MSLVPVEHCFGSVHPVDSSAWVSSLRWELGAGYTLELGAGYTLVNLFVLPLPLILSITASGKLKSCHPCMPHMGSWTLLNL